MLVHGAEGTDATLLVTALAQVILDPGCRTVVGFQGLLEREWIEVRAVEARGGGPQPVWAPPVAFTPVISLTFSGSCRPATPSTSAAPALPTPTPG